MGGEFGSGKVGYGGCKDTKLISFKRRHLDAEVVYLGIYLS